MTTKRREPGAAGATLDDADGSQPRRALFGGRVGDPHELTRARKSREDISRSRPEAGADRLASPPLRRARESVELADGVRSIGLAADARVRMRVLPALDEARVSGEVNG